LSVYWTDYGAGTILKADRGGGVTTLATGQNNPGHLVVDGTGVYWTNYGDSGSSSTNGSVMKLTPK